MAGGSTGNILGKSYTVNRYQRKPKYLCAEICDVCIITVLATWDMAAVYDWP